MSRDTIFQTLQSFSKAYTDSNQKTRINVKNHLRDFLSSPDLKCLLIDTRDDEYFTTKIYEALQEFLDSDDTTWKQYCDTKNVFFLKWGELSKTMEGCCVSIRFPLLLIIRGLNLKQSDKCLTEILNGVNVSVRRKIILLTSVPDSLDWSISYFSLNNWKKIDEPRNKITVNDDSTEIKEVFIIQSVLKGNLKDLQHALGIVKNLNGILYQKKQSLLHLAVNKGHKQILTLLLLAGSKISLLDSNENSVLHYSCYTGNLDIAMVLLENDAEVNCSNRKGITPIHVAAEKGYKDMMLLLLRYGADLTFKCKSGFTPMHYASERGHLSIIEELIKSGLDVNEATFDKTTPLHLASRFNHKDVVKFLLDHAALVNYQNKIGNTALHLALSKGHSDIAVLLVNAGANFDIRNSAGVAPIQMAKIDFIEHLQDLSKLF